MKGKRIFYGLAVIIFLLLIVGCSPNPISQSAPSVNTVQCDDSSNKYLCYESAAIEKLDYSICEQLSNLALVGQCSTEVSLAADDLSHCEKSLVAPQCYYMHAIKNEDVSLCKKTDISSDACYRNLAKLKGEESYCDMIADQEYKDKCHLEFSEPEEEIVPQKKIDSCLEIEDQTDREYCYIDIARKTGDYSQCENINYAYAKDTCFQAAANNKKDVIICNKVQGTYKRGLCKKFVAVDLDDLEICSEIEDNDWEYECKVAIADKRKDASICDDINVEDSTYQEKCYFFVALKSQNRSLCDLIDGDKAPYYEQRCLSEVEEVEEPPEPVDGWYPFFLNYHYSCAEMEIEVEGGFEEGCIRYCIIMEEIDYLDYKCGDDGMAYCKCN